MPDKRHNNMIAKLRRNHIRELSELRRKIAAYIHHHGCYEGFEAHLADQLGVSVEDIKRELKALETGKAKQDFSIVNEAPPHVHQRVYEMHLAGYPHDQIASMCQVNESDIFLIVDYVARWSSEHMQLDLQHVRHHQVQKLEALSNLALDMFHQSRQDSVTVTTGTDAEGNEYYKEQRKGQSGDPRFLDLARSCQSDIRKVVGADAPAKTALTNAQGDGPAEINVTVSALPIEQRESMAEALKILDDIEFKRIS